MAKRHAGTRARSTGRTRKRAPNGRSGKRPTGKRQVSRTPATGRKRGGVKAKVTAKAKTAASRKPAKRQASKRTRRAGSVAAGKRPRLDRARRTLDETVQTPPSSLDMNRRGSAVRTGRAEVQERLQEHQGMSPAITGGDVDVDVQNAYFTGDEAPGGDNQTPDQDIVDDIGKALGVEYQDNEELKASDKVTERDKHRWELDPASSEDYQERKKP